MNLTAFETFVPERRPFFQEDRDLFYFPLVGGGGAEAYPDQLFYSRRVGRAPQWSPAPGEELLDAPRAAPILGAMKLTGRTARGWSVGLFGAATGAAQARVRTRYGDIESREIEPAARMAVGRIERTFGGGRSTVGVLFTGIERSTGDPALDFLHTSAVAGGVNLRHRFASDRYLLRAWLLGSRVAGSEEAIARTQRHPSRYLNRPDAEHFTYDPTRTSLIGMAGEVMLTRIQGPWIGLLMTGSFSPTVEVNDLGFQRLADARYLVARWGYERNQPGEHLRRWSSHLTLTEARTHGGEPFLRSLELYGTVTGHDEHRIDATLTRTASVLSTAALRGGPALRIDGATNVSSTFYSDPRGALNGGAGLAASRHDGGRGFDLEFRTLLRHQPTPRWTLSLEARYRLERVAAQWTGRTGSGAEALLTHGRMDQRIFAAVFRTGSQSRHSPGVTGDLAIGRDLDRLLRGTADHVLLLKVTWWTGW